MSKKLLLIAFMVSFWCGLCEAQQNLLKNGDFEKTDRQGRVIGWEGNTPNLRIVRLKGKGRVLHFKSVAGDQSGKVTQKIKVDPDWLEITIKGKIRTKGTKLGDQSWQTPKVNVVWVDEQGKVIGYPGSLGLDKDSDWVEQVRTFKVDPRAVELWVQPAQFASAGEIWFDDIQVTATKAGEIPSTETLYWGKEKIEVLTPQRAEVVLNGWWRFYPVDSKSKFSATGSKVPTLSKINPKQWGWMRVPGTWGTNQWPRVPTTKVIQGQGKGWEAFDPRVTDRAWFEREIRIPAGWRNRAILLDMQRVSTDAWVYVNGKYAGSVEWPYGVVDLTDHVRPGQKANLRILVLAVPEEGMVKQYMETQTAQVTEKKAKLHSRGIIGDVVLTSRPKGGHVSDVFVQPSVRKKQVTLDIELSDVSKAGSLEIKVEMMTERGRIEKVFSKRMRVTRQDQQVLKTTFNWDNPRIWDFRSPEMYIARVSVNGPDLKDSYAQRFGFREFWIEGQKYFLNGRPFKARPGLGWRGVTIQEIDASIDQLMTRGFNLKEIWPQAADRRGTYMNWELYVDRADRKGLPITAVALSINDVVNLWERDNGEHKLRWQERMTRDLKRYRNHPSIMMWACSANYFGFNGDQNPRNIGQRGKNTGNYWWNRNKLRAEEGIGMIKAVDPTRPVFTHQGGDVGDVHTVNMYLNMIPVQEREEWLSDYVKHGEMPFWPVEFGMPINITMRRGRNNHSNGDRSEPLMTEWTAQRLGRKAYEWEEAQYRAGIKSAYLTEEKLWQFRQPEIHTQRAFQELIRQDVIRVWRSWRTWGLYGGMLPWNDGHAYEKLESYEALAKAPPFKPGLRGPYFALGKAGLMEGDLSKHHRLLPAGKAFLENNNDTLAWIAGRQGHFTSKRHQYVSGAELSKQVVVINDFAEAQTYQLAITVQLGKQTLKQEQFKGSIATAKVLKLPLKLTLPKVSGKTIGKITLKGKIGTREHEDRFEFTVFPERTALGGELWVFDPTGKTSRMLRAMGYQVNVWRAGSNPQRMPMLIIGEMALNAGNDDIDGDGARDGTVKLPGDLKAYVQAGGRVMIMAQDAEWLKKHLGWRSSAHVLRYAFAVEQGHPVLTGLSDENLSNWAGSGTVVESHPQAYHRLRNGKPYHGYRWGNRGSVASIAIEKPHRTAWRPIIEAGFDLQYAGMMELDYGKGRVIYNAMDLTDQALIDPAAALLLDQSIRYLREASPVTRARKTVYIGSPEGRKTLDLLGVQYQVAQSPSDADLLISDDPQWIGKARRVVILAQSRARLGRGLNENFSGSLKVPDWDEARGLSPSDLRLRVDHPAIVFKPGDGVGAEGWLRRTVSGDRVTMELQLNPFLMNTEAEPYYRFSAWRQTRAIAQVLSNMGAQFKMDEAFFDFRPIREGRISLAGQWKIKMTHLNPLAASPKDIVGDKGISKLAQRAVTPRFNDRSWKSYPVPSIWDTYGDDFAGRDGEGVYRRWVEIPPQMQKKDLIISFGPVRDTDEVYFNGVKIGSGKERNKVRHYLIPKKLIKRGRNLLAIRVFNPFYFGGLEGDEKDYWIGTSDYKTPPTPYHPDFREDFNYGDDPYRYYRW